MNVAGTNAYGVDATFDNTADARGPFTIAFGFEGVTDLANIVAAAPLGTFHLSIREAGSTVEQLSVDLTPTVPTMTGFDAFGYSITGLPNGIYDFVLKGDKSLAVLDAGVVISNTNQAAPDILLPAGDANNDNSVDTTDFGVLVGAYNGDSTVSGSGYDPAADFNYDGVVDTTDFGLLVGEYNNTGAI